MHNPLLTETLPTHKYYWFVRGKFLNIVERDDDGFLVPPAKEVSFLRSGTAGDDDARYGGLQMEMTKVPFSLNDGTEFDDLTTASEIPVNQSLEESIIDYVKAQLADDAEDPRHREYFMNRFRRKVSRFGATRTGGARIAMGTSFMR